MVVKSQRSSKSHTHVVESPVALEPRRFYDSISGLTCQICNVAYDLDEEEREGDPLVTCESCDLVVHINCYGSRFLKVFKAHLSAAPTNTQIKAAIAAIGENRLGALKCLHCRMNRPLDRVDPCLVCSLSVFPRSMKLVVDSNPSLKSCKQLGFAHISCVDDFDELFFYQPTHHDFIGGLNVLYAKQRAPCVICVEGMGASGGYTLKCSAKGCSVNFHALCARSLGWEVQLVNLSSRRRNRSKLKAKSHSGSSSFSKKFKLKPSDGEESSEEEIAEDDDDHHQEGDKYKIMRYCGPHSSLDALRNAALQDLHCCICSLDKDHKETLICDNCNRLFHTYCLTPPLSAIPEADWSCHECVSKGNRLKMLVENVDMEPPKMRVAENDYLSNSKKIMAHSEFEVPEFIMDYAEGPFGTDEETAESVFSNVLTMLQLLDPASKEVVIAAGVGNIALPALAMALSAGNNVVFSDGETLLSEESKHADVLVVVNPPGKRNKLLPLHDQFLHGSFKLLVVVCENLQSLYPVETILKEVCDYKLLSLSNTELDRHYDYRRKEQEQKRSSKSLGLLWILKSLTPNHRAILKLLVENAGNTGSIPFDGLLKLTSNAMVASSDPALRSHLVELVDHGVIERVTNLVTLILPADLILATLEQISNN